MFIHFYIGHLEEEHGENSYLNFRNMVAIEVILTFCLAGILYYEGDVSSKIAIIQGTGLMIQGTTSTKNHWRVSSRKESSGSLRNTLLE